MKTATIVFAVVLLVIIVGGAYYLSTNGMTPNYTTTPSTATTTTGAAASSAHVMTSTNQVLGTFLTDSNGMTLYHFTKDTTGTQTSDPVTACTGACAQLWPPLAASSVTVEPVLNQNDFTTFARSDGTMQVAYKGMPLYFYSGDTNPGNTNGQGIGNIWFVVSLSSPTTSTTSATAMATSSTTTTTTSAMSSGSGYP